MTDLSPQPVEPAPADEAAPRPLNVTALFAEAAGKSGLLWIEVPGERTWPVWHTVAGGDVLVVSGPGEQQLPWLPDTVHLILRSKDTGGRLLTVNARVREVPRDTAEWTAAVEALKGERLNAPAGLEERWAQECVIRSLQPFGAAVEAPGTASTTAHRAPVLPAPAATARWRPWHLRGRPQRRRRQR